MATISLCMIARDEESNIARAIDSVKEIVDEIIVVDTGSKDSTAKIARELGASVFHFEWTDDFSAARNFSISKATSDWILILDADEELLPDDASRLRQLAELGNDAYIFIQKNFSNTQGFGYIPESRRGFKGFYPSFIIRMFRNGNGISFEGFVHETVDASLAKIKGQAGISAIPIYHFQELKGQDAFREKQLKYADSLEKNIDRFPNKAKAYHDIGITHYRFRQDYEKAISMFRKSLDVNANSSRVLNDMGAAYAQTGDYKRAIEAFGKSIEQKRESSTFYNIALLQEKLGNYEAAWLAYEEAASLNHPKKKELLEKAQLLRQVDKEKNGTK